MQSMLSDTRLKRSVCTVAHHAYNTDQKPEWIRALQEFAVRPNLCHAVIITSASYDQVMTPFGKSSPTKHGKKDMRLAVECCERVFQLQVCYPTSEISLVNLQRRVV
jgi:hypothetical protein